MEAEECRIKGDGTAHDRFVIFPLAEVPLFLVKYVCVEKGRDLPVVEHVSI